jgi:hypothetical protein
MPINLEQSCPEATPAEIKRFLNARKGSHKAALKQLQSYIEWRREHGLEVSNIPMGISVSASTVSSSRSLSYSEYDDEDFYTAASYFEDDQDQWDDAAFAALSICSKGEKPDIRTLPRLARFDANDGSEEMHDKEGNRILQLLPAQMDVSIASEKAYALALAFYLDKKLSRDSMEKINVLIDVRAGEGWANPPASKMVPFIKLMNNLLERNFPERLAKCMVLPMPTYATSLWKIIKMFLDSNTAKKFTVLGGDADTHSSLPPKAQKYISSHVVNQIETNRRDSFLCMI